MLTDWIAMKKTQMLSPKSTPARPARRKSRRLGHRLVTATITNSTADAIHIRQNDSTTPEACVDLPSTPPIDQNSAATTIAMTPPRPVVRPPSRDVRNPPERGSAMRDPDMRGAEVAGVVTWAR